MITPTESHAIARAINHRNVRASRRADAAAAFVVVLVVAILGTLALVHFMTPCNAATLCMAAAIPTQRGWLERATRAWRCYYLRSRIASALADIQAMENVLQMAQQELDFIPDQIQAHRVWIDAHMAELDSIELDTRAA